MAITSYGSGVGGGVGVGVWVEAWVGEGVGGRLVAVGETGVCATIVGVLLVEHPVANRRKNANRMMVDGLASRMPKFGGFMPQF